MDSDDNLSVDKTEVNGVDSNIQGNYDESIHSLDLSSCFDSSKNGQKSDYPKLL